MKPSRPVRARGLKLEFILSVDVVLQVAPRAGAWIETSGYVFTAISNLVAPRAGAWIETSGGSDERRSSRGRAPCGRVD